MRSLEIEDIKKCSFQVLRAVRDVCEANNIAYSLTGGTLIGAVRHQGFIPWDDDIDIMMPRPDYDKFIQIVKAGDYGFDLHCLETDGQEYLYPFAKACCRGTLLKERSVQETRVALGVYVDIFPVDGAGNNLRLAKLRTMIFQVLHGLKITSNWTCYHKSKLRKWYYEPFRYVCYLISRLLGRSAIDKMIDRFLRGKAYGACAYAGRLVGDYGSREVMPRRVFDSIVKVDFEGERFDAIEDYDTFLRTLYGDYMQLPPAEKQVSHHEFDAYWVE